MDRGDAVAVLNAEGEAEIRLVDEATGTYEYRPLSGDPLGLLAATGTVDAGVNLRLRETEWFALTRNSARPDPLRRLWRAFHGSVKHPAAVLVSFADGYEIGNPALLALSSLRGRFGTHGSMTRMASLGVLLSSWRPVADVDAWGAKEVLFGAPVVAATQQVEDGDVVPEEQRHRHAIGRPWTSASMARAPPGASMSSIISIQQVSKTYASGFQALEARRPRDPPRRDLRAARSQRRRQDHADQHHLRHRQRQQRHACIADGHDIVRDYRAARAQDRPGAAGAVDRRVRDACGRR